MRLKVLGAYGSDGQGQRPSAFLVDDHVLVDAGTVGGALSVPEQIAITHAVLSHAHLDHTVGLAFLADTLAMVAPERSVTACSIARVIETLRTHVFNDALWPDFTRLPSRRRATARLRAIPEGGTFSADGVLFRPVRVNHIVPTFGYLVSTPRVSILFSSDTGPTRALWALAEHAENLKAIFLEVSFSNAQAQVALASKHLTPKLVAAELEKTTRDVPVYLYHLKPPSEAAIRREVRALKMPRLKIVEAGEVLEF